MKRSEFPEKVYEAMILHELLTFFSKPNTTPFYVPSQIIENGLGFDLCFFDNNGVSINRKVMLIQFKTSSRYDDKSNKGFYKMEIYKSPKSSFKQHNLLCNYNLSSSCVVGVYCSPRFVTYKEFYEKVKTNRVISDSSFFEPTKTLSAGHHYIKFNSISAYQHSNEEDIYLVNTFREIVETIEPISLESFK